MSSFEGYRAEAEALQASTTKSGGVSSHDRAMQQYLIAAQLRRAKEGAAATPTAASGPEAPVQSTSATAAAPSESIVAIVNDENSPPGAIVVGIDGSASADAAAAWAADEADRRHAPLRLVHAYRLPIGGGHLGYNAIPDDLPDRLRASGDELLETTAAQLATAHPNLTIVRTLFHGRADEALRRTSEQARLTVVGNAPAPRAVGVLLGSVALAVTSTNPAPVAVIHANYTRDEGPIVVGVDGSPLSEAAVAFAFDEAAVRGTNLIAVHAWNDIYLDSRRLEPLLIDPQTLEQQERALLSERLAGWAEKYPDVQVEQILDFKRPTTTLLQYSHTAQAVVVGSHGRGGFMGMLLGSTSHALATHAQCPVIVVRTSSGSVR